MGDVRYDACLIPSKGMLGIIKEESLPRQGWGARISGKCSKAIFKRNEDLASDAYAQMQVILDSKKIK